MEIYIPFLRDKKIGGQLAPSHAPFFSKLSDQNFEIAIFFSIAERPNNFAFGDIITFHNPRKRSLSYKICPFLTYSICYWEVAHTFLGGEERIFGFWNFPWG